MRIVPLILDSLSWIILLLILVVIVHFLIIDKLKNITWLIIIFGLGVLLVILSFIFYKVIAGYLLQAFGIGLVSYSYYLFRGLKEGDEPYYLKKVKQSPNWPKITTWLLSKKRYRTISGLLLLLLVINLFQTANAWGHITGEKHVLELLDGSASVTVYSKYKLGKMHGRSISTDGYIYTGLKILTYANGKYFLVPEDWSNNKPVIILPDDETIMIEVLPPTPTPTSDEDL